MKDYRFVFLLWVLMLFVKTSFCQANYIDKIARARTEVLPTKIEFVNSVARSRLETTTPFEYGVFALQYYMPFHFSVGKIVDTVIKDEFVDRLLNIRPVLFFYNAYRNEDFGVGGGLKISNRIGKRWYWGYQLGMGWFEGNGKQGIKKSVNFFHVLSLSFLLSNRITLSVNGSHISNGDLFGKGSNQDMIGLGIGYNLFKKK